MAKLTKISIVIPCYNESGNLTRLVKEITKNVPLSYQLELILVDDGSKDSTFADIRALSKKKKFIKGIIFYRNFGHQSALMAGISHAKGDAVITMDADLQHPPKYLPEMIKLWRNGHDLVVAQKQNDMQLNFILKFFREITYKTWSVLSGGLLSNGISDFRLTDRSLVDYFSSIPERRILLRGIFMMQSRNPAVFKYDVGVRIAGESKYTLHPKNLARTVRLFTDGLVGFSFLPLRLASLIGLFFMVLGFLFLIYAVFSKFIAQKPIIEGWVTLVTIQTISFGFLVFYLGVIGEYIGTIFEEVKQRPRYWIKELVNFTNHDKKM